MDFNGKTMEKLEKITIFKFGKSTINGPYLIAMLYYIYCIISGWWYTYPSEKYEWVSWDYEIPNIWKYKIHVPNHQPGLVQDAGIPLCNTPNGIFLLDLIRTLKFHLFRTFFPGFLLHFWMNLAWITLKSGKAEVNNVTPWIGAGWPSLGHHGLIIKHHTLI